MPPRADCNNVCSLTLSLFSPFCRYSSPPTSVLSLSFSNSSLVSFRSNRAGNGSTTNPLFSFESCSSFFLTHSDEIILAWRGNVHRFTINYLTMCVCVCVCMREREREIVARSHRHRPANANGSTKVIIASQRGRRNTWPLIIEMSAYLARRWNRVSRAAVPAYTAGVASCSMPRVLKNPPGKSSILALLCPPFLWDDRFNFAGIEARVSDKTGLILGRSPSFR